MSEDSNGKHVPRLAASTSFTEEEVDALDQLIKAILGKRDTQIIGRSKAFPRIAAKVVTMKRTIEVQRTRRAEFLAGKEPG
jgi:hypothetical protein